MKTCSKCKAEKPYEAFNRQSASLDGRQSWCRECTKGSPSASGAATCSRCGSPKPRSLMCCDTCLVPAEKHCTKCKLLKVATEFIPVVLSSGRKSLQSHCKSCAYAHQRTHRKTPGVRALNRRRSKSRYASDPSFRIRLALGKRLLRALNGSAKAGPTLELLGCPPVWLEAWLESLFRPGMTLNNHGRVWHIDHIKPCAAFDLTDPEQQRICFHWTNLQPLFAKENLSKGDRYEI